MDAGRVGLPALLPYLRAHRGTLAVVAVLSLLSAGASLAQPALVRVVLDAIGSSRPVGPAVGNVRNNGPHLLDAPMAATLF